MALPNLLFASIYFLESMCILRSCNAIFLVKFRTVVHHYRQTMGDFSGHDPLEDVGLRDWKIICNAVIRAKQFAGSYHNNFYRRKIRPIVDLSEWNPAENAVWGKKQFRYTERNVMIETAFYAPKMVKSVQCLGTMYVKWFVTYGGDGGYLFLLEPSSRQARSKLRVTGLFEPSAKLKDKSVEHFFHQLRRTVTKENMVRSICGLTEINRLRLCSSVFDALGRKGRLKIPQRNFVDQEKHCVRKVVVEKKKFRGTTHFLPCATIQTEDNFRTEYSLVGFYVLADASERGAVFVFFEIEGEKLELRARITKVGAFLHPVKKVGKGVRKDRIDDEDTDEEIVEDREEEPEGNEDEKIEEDRDEESEENGDEETEEDRDEESEEEIGVKLEEYSGDEEVDVKQEGTMRD